MKSHHYLQLGLFLVYILITTTLLIKMGIGLTPDRYLVVLLIGALLVKHSKHFIHDFAPFVLIIIAYDFFRGFADDINGRVHYRASIETTKLIFNNHFLTTELQKKFFDPKMLHWYDYTASFLYLLHFAIPLTFGFALWFYNRNYFREFMLGLAILSYSALIFYLLYPTAPPWLASQNGFIPHVTKILNVVTGMTPESVQVPTLYRYIGANLVAAIPSMHAGYSFLVFLFSVRFFKKLGWLALIYAISMWITIIYLGEHYPIDIILGVLLAYLSFLLAHLIAFHYRKELKML